MIDKEPKSYIAYTELLDIIEQYNNNIRLEDGKAGLFREISFLAYQIIAQNNREVTYSPNFQNLLDEINQRHKRKRRIKGKITESTTTSGHLTNKKISDTLKRLAESASFGFKLIAIKPLENCNPSYLNVLKPNQTYYFEKAFEINKDKIDFNPEKAISLYDQSMGSRNTLKVNVTAIVGKNGSGKSSLLELFFRIINNITYTLKNELSTNDLILEEGLEAEMYYLISGELFCITVINDQAHIQNFEYVGNAFVKNTKKRSKFAKSDFDNLFYSVVVNYSHHSLNSKILGEWVQKLFHKNDSYQTPLVINPMRTEGIIDINVENNLVKSRLMANLFSPLEEDGNLGIRQITEYQHAKRIHFERIIDKNEVLFTQKNTKGEDKKILFSDLKTEVKFILQLVDTVFGELKANKQNSSIVISETEKYIVKKLAKISITYPHYSDYFNKNKLEFDDSKLKRYLELLKDDKSHITYKLKQAINYLKYPELLSKDDGFKVDIEEYSNVLENFISRVEDIEIIELLPPPIFSSSIKLLDRSGKEADFEKLSSGEKQLVHSISSILYHIKYIDSVSSNKDELVGYRNINLLLDEIEMYYHPELQRKYLSHLLRMIGSLSLTKIEAINICLVTHSPYILSDVPEFYTLRLKEGSPVDEESKTFGANIHDLLANDFFMDNGFMGEFAKKKIEETIQFLNYRKLKNDEFQINARIDLMPEQTEKEKLTDQLKKIRKHLEEFDTEKMNMDIDFHKAIINQIGEPIIQNKLQDMLEDILPDSDKQNIAIEKIKRIMKDANLDIESIRN